MRRNVKTSGGLTQGNSMSDLQCLVWLISIPACAGVNRAMQEVTYINYDTSEQHKDLAKTRQEHDHQDTKKLLHILIDRSPFGADSSLHSIVTGITAGPIINVDKAKEVGNLVLKSMAMVCTNAQDIISFNGKAQAVTLATDKGRGCQ